MFIQFVFIKWIFFKRVTILFLQKAHVVIVVIYMYTLEKLEKSPNVNFIFYQHGLSSNS